MSARKPPSPPAVPPGAVLTRSFMGISTVFGFVMGLLALAQFGMTWFDRNKPILTVRTQTYQVLDRQKLLGIDALRPPFSTLRDPPFKVIAEDGSEVQQPIYEVQISVWNRGSVALGAERLRTPLEITLPNATSLGSPRVLHADPRDGLEVQVGGGKPPHLRLRWKYMDPDRGFRLSLVYTADRPALLDRVAYIDGILENANLPAASRYPLQAIILVLMVLGSATLLLFLGTRQKSPVYAMLFAAGGILVLMGGTWYLVNAALTLVEAPF